MNLNAHMKELLRVTGRRVRGASTLPLGALTLQTSELPTARQQSDETHVLLEIDLGSLGRGFPWLACSIDSLGLLPREHFCKRKEGFQGELQYRATFNWLLAGRNFLPSKCG
jgi:hypothetical protein